jgi:hypothetical protein
MKLFTTNLKRISINIFIFTTIFNNFQFLKKKKKKKKHKYYFIYKYSCKDK